MHWIGVNKRCSRILPPPAALMVFHTQEFAWMGPLSAITDKMSSPIKGLRAHIHPDASQELSEELRPCRAFDLAEAMEMGMGPGTTASHLEAPPETEERSLLVERSQDRKRYQLVTDGGNVLFTAFCRNDGIQFDIFETASTERPQNSQPLFTLESCSTSKKKWALKSTCDNCEMRGRRQCGVRQLMRISQYSETIGESQAHCMDVELPGTAPSGEPNVWCTACSSKATPTDVAPAAEGLTSRRPRWSTKYKSLTLDFYRRASMASSKNFQLQLPGKPEKKARLLFGKVSSHEFVLDYRRPLGALHAFACALSVSHWD